MLEKLKRLINLNGIAAVSHGLGYRSTTTVSRWIKEGKIPAIAESKVKNYLKRGKKCPKT